MKKLYILTVLLCSFLSYVKGQKIRGISPGGVGGVELWFKTEPVGNRKAGSAYSVDHRWVDYSGDSLKLNYFDSRGATFGTEVTNNSVRFYNTYPALGLNKLNEMRYFNVLLRKNNLSQATIFSVFAPNSNFDSEVMLYALNGRPGQGVWIGSDKIYPSIESKKDVFDYGEDEGFDLKYSSNDPEPSLNKFKENSMRILTYYRTLPPKTDVWGEKSMATLTFSGAYNTIDVNNTSTFNIPSGVNRKFTGYSPEVIAYSRLLTPFERRKVDSYLALKYGLTLPVSYLGSDGLLIWDYSANSSYNNRITAIYKDDVSGVDHSEASTSNEEAPFYSYDIDYFHFASPYNQTSAQKLLAISNQSHLPMNDKEYFVFGDNDKSIKTVPSKEFAGINIMPRKWLLKTNVKAPDIDTIAKLKWITNGVTVNYTDDFQATMQRFPNQVQGGAETSLPLWGKNGYIACNLDNVTGKLNLQFHTPKRNYYGYHFDATGYIYKLVVINGQISSTRFGGLKPGARVEVIKEGNIITLRENGRDFRQEIVIDKTDEDVPFYGSMLMETGNQVLRNLRHGGFVETGHRVELSSYTNRATEFNDYLNGKSYLIVDRSGTGDFAYENTDFYEINEWDPNRSKLVFNNVFWDIDGNGKEVFTFGYRKDNLVAQIREQDVDCSSPTIGGNIQIDIVRGDESFEYELINKDNPEDIRRGNFLGTAFTLPNIPAGNYNLTLKETGGFDISSNGTGLEAKANSHRYINAATSGDIFETTLKDTDGIFHMGIAPYGTIQAITLQYGFEVNKGLVYLIDNRVKNTLSVEGVKLQAGDKIEIYNNKAGQVEYRVNGTVFYTQKITQTYYFIVKIVDNSTKLYNVKHMNTTVANWNYQGVKMSPLSNSSVEQAITVGAICEETPSVDDSKESIDKGSDNMVVFKQLEARSIKARVTLTKEETLSFLVYNMQGVLIASETLSVPRTIHETDFTFPQSGVYVIKAITADEEFSKKVLIQ